MRVICSEIWKKILALHSTFTRPLFVPNIGAVTVAVPSLGVLVSKEKKLAPLLSEKRIFTLAQLTGGAVVLATFQFTVCSVFENQVVPPMGAVTLNGPEALLTVTFIASLLTPPLLSRPVSRKVMVRLILGNASPRLDS